MVSEIAVEIVKGLTSVVISRWQKASTKGPRCELSSDDAAFAHHLHFANSWSSQISLRDAGSAKQLQDLHVDLEMGDVQANSDNSCDDSNTFSLKDALEQFQHILLLGGPGAGKTTSIKYLIRQILTVPADTFLEDIDFPVLIRCREMEGSRDLYSAILSTLGVNVEWTYHSSWDDDERAKFRSEQTERLVSELLEEKHALILIDGLDELPQSSFGRFYHQVLRLLNACDGSKFFITARSGSVSTAFEHCQTMWLKPLHHSQVAQLARNWLKRDELTQQFLTAVDATPYRDSLDRPLTVAHLCMIFQAYGEIPSPPVLIYQRIINLYLEDWDRERAIKRDSSYARFGPERKRQFLSAMAYELSERTGAAVITRPRLLEAYKYVHRKFTLPADEAVRVAEEIESHTGLLVRTSFDRYEFSHKSLEEFLVADYIVRSQTVRAPFSAWRHLPDACAIAGALSADPSEFLWTLVVGTYLEIERAESLWDTDQILDLFWCRYLARVAVERPGFIACEALAVSILYLDALCWAGPTGRPNARSIRPAVRGALQVLLDIPEVIPLIQQAVNSFNAKTHHRQAFNLWTQSIPRVMSTDLPSAITIGADLY